MALGASQLAPRFFPLKVVGFFQDGAAVRA
jgi:hypothetical protein